MQEKCKKQKLRKEQIENESKSYFQQRNNEKAQEINSVLYLLKKKQTIKYNDYQIKQKKDKEKINKLNIKKQEENEERKLNNYYRFANHEYLIDQIKKNDNQRNKDYFDKQIIIKQNKTMIKNEKDKKNEERRQMMEEKNDITQYNIRNSEIISNNFRERVKNKILDREKKTAKIMNDIKLEHIRKQEDNNEKTKEMEYIIKCMKCDDCFKRNQKRKELDKKREQIDNFINEKEMINEKKRDINDNYNYQKYFYSGKIDELMYKRPMDNVALNNIHDIVRDNRNLAGVVQNIDK